MRTIKFRAWDGKQMIFFGKFNIMNTGGFWGGDREVWEMAAYYAVGNPESGGGYFHDDFAEECKDVKIMQFTGLLDKNGKEIYEGDIVRVLFTDWPSKEDSDPRTLDQYLEDISKVFKVVFLQGQFLGKRKEEYNPFYTDDDGYAYCKLIPERHGFVKVIGNIHEKPELL